jgi:hypothetical protein
MFPPIFGDLNFLHFQSGPSTILEQPNLFWEHLMMRIVEEYILFSYPLKRIRTDVSLQNSAEISGRNRPGTLASLAHHGFRSFPDTGLGCPGAQSLQHRP